MTITDRPTLDQLAETARTIVSGRQPSMTYIAEDTVKRRITCGAADSRSSHSEIECLADTLLETGDGPHHQAGVELSAWLAEHMYA